MKDGFKIVDVDAHLMEPDWVFENIGDLRKHWVTNHDQ